MRRVPPPRKVVRVRALGACHEWQGSVHPLGYGYCRYKGKTWRAHRAAWDEQVGPIPEGMHVLHHCDNRRCVRIEHLFLGTHLDNMHDCAAKGRRPRLHGERNGSAHVSQQVVEEIRRRYTGTKAGNPAFVSQTQLAREYGLTQGQVSKIVRGAAWRAA